MDSGRFECGKLGWVGRFGEIEDGKWVDLRGGGKEENTGGGVGKKCGRGIRRREEDRDGDLGGMCGLGWGGI